MRRALTIAEKTGFLRILQSLKGNESNSLYVLNYHRVDEVNHRPWLSPGLISTTPIEFEKQMQLVAHYYHPVTAEEVIRAARGESELPNQAVLVTVDDGYLDFKESIFPIAKKFGISPVLFVVTAFVGQGKFWWDQLHQLIYHSEIEQLNTPLGLLSIRSDEEKENTYHRLSQLIKSAPFEKAMSMLDKWTALTAKQGEDERTTLNWDELRELSRSGVVIASHTHTHPILSHILPEQARKEIRESQNIIQREIGFSSPIFAYPDGKPDSINPEVEKILIKEGFQLAFTTQEGIAKLGKDNHFQLRRIVIWPSLSLAKFHYHLTPFYRP